MRLEKLSLNEKTLGKWSMPGSSPARLACWHIFGNFGPPAMHESLVVGYAISCLFMSLSLHNNSSFTQQADVSKLKFSICYISHLPLVMFQARKSWRLNRSVSSTLCCDIFFVLLWLFVSFFRADLQMTFLDLGVLNVLKVGMKLIIFNH